MGTLSFNLPSSVGLLLFADDMRADFSMPLNPSLFSTPRCSSRFKRARKSPTGEAGALAMSAAASRPDTRPRTHCKNSYLYVMLLVFMLLVRTLCFLEIKVKRDTDGYMANVRGRRCRLHIPGRSSIYAPSTQLTLVLP